MQNPSVQVMAGQISLAAISLPVSPEPGESQQFSKTSDLLFHNFIRAVFLHICHIIYQCGCIDKLQNYWCKTTDIKKNSKSCDWIKQFLVLIGHN